MKKIRIAILCPSEIAFRRFMPALKKLDSFEYVGVGVANELEWFGKIDPNNNVGILTSEKEKALKFKESFGGTVFESYDEILKSDLIDAVYIPLPPALHYKWAKLALENGKHVLVEKPSTTSYDDTYSLVEIAKKNNLALHENYMFNFHSQLDYIENLLKEGRIGDVRLYRIYFGFPFRGTKDFRYNKALGGGALLDCGGYTIKLAGRLLGNNIELTSHQLNYKEGFEVDIYGSGMIKNKEGQVAQIAFGMDNSYKCELEVWGEKGTIYTNRVLTAPDGYQPVVEIKEGNDVTSVTLESDDSFKKSIAYFLNCINDKDIRNKQFNDMLVQSKIVDKFKEEN